MGHDDLEGGSEDRGQGPEGEMRRGHISTRALALWSVSPVQEPDLKIRKQFQTGNLLVT